MLTTLTLQDRADLYAKAHPDWPKLQVDRQISGMFIMGANYKTSGYYGAYPHGYLERMNSMFPDAERILHLFSGSMPAGNYVRFDRKGVEGSQAEVIGEAEKLADYFTSPRPVRQFDLIFADPPYSIEDCEHYGCAMVNRNKVLAECVKVLEPGGFVLWLDQVLPMFRKAELQLAGVIGMVKSTNHRFRVITMFRKRLPDETAPAV